MLSENQRKVLKQYDSEQGLEFYRRFMGEFNIHYGIYENPYEDVTIASENVIKFMVNLIHKRLSLGSEHCIVDLGSGTGGAAHYLALTYGCQVTCVNIGLNQNQQNSLRAKELGIAHLIDIVECSFEDLPLDWSNKFDVVWSEEAFCHAEDKHQVIREAKRVLKPGGTFVFTDIMLAEKASMDDVKAFTAKNAVTDLSCIKDYVEWCVFEKLKNFTYHDLTTHLWINFHKLIERIDSLWNQMNDGGVSEAYLKEFRQSLLDRLDLFEKDRGAFAWGCFYMTKALEIPSNKIKILIAERSLNSVSVRPLSQENLGDLGTVFANEDWHNIQLTQVQWTSPTGRKILDGKGISKLVEAEMIVTWDSESLSAENKAINYKCPNLAHRDCEGNIYLEWFNRHEDGGQAFICPGHKLLYVIAPPVSNPKPQDFQAFVSNGSYGVMLQPNVWHTNPIPLEDLEVRILTRQCELDATIDCHLASEHQTWLKITGLTARQ
ncbi:MAG: methyltransferase domain-containing protein [Oscillatoria sp. SIO1A7]|nr:methyltransferase domain-containing protein [Oscillatoria sp. SIO1A7]